MTRTKLQPHVVNDWEHQYVIRVAQCVNEFFGEWGQTLVRVSELPDFDHLPREIQDWKIPVLLPRIRTIFCDYTDWGVIKKSGLESRYHIVYLSFGGDVSSWVERLNDFAYTVKFKAVDPPYSKGGIHKPQHFGDVGHDLECSKTTWIPPQGMARVPANIALELPPTLYGWITARSSFAARRLVTPNGIIDAGYRGPIFVQIMNLNDQEEEIKEGERMGQIIFQSILPIRLRGALRFTAPTDRGSDGFGSTG